MRRLIASALIAALPLSVPFFDFTPKHPELSIRHLSTVYTNPKIDEGKPHRHNDCTTFALKTKTGTVWVANFHCLVHTGEDRHVGKNDVEILITDPTLDLAIFSSAEQAPALELASHGLNIGDPLTVVGFPFGWSHFIYRVGIFSQEFDVTNSGTDWAILQIPAAPGDSGSPVLNSRLQVVGVLQAIFCDENYIGFCPMAAMVPLEHLRQLVSVLERE